jgi:hypothetical protein
LSSVCSSLLLVHERERADIDRSPNSTKSYELPETVPTIPLAPAKVTDTAPEPDFVMLDNSTGDDDGGKAAAGKKRAAEDDAEEAEGGGKRRKVEVIEADDSDFEIM